MPSQERRRAPRVATELPTLLQLKPWAASRSGVFATVVDVSRVGARLTLSPAFRFAPGEELAFDVAGVRQAQAVARWRESGMLGVEFVAPLPDDAPPHGDAQPSTAWPPTAA